MDPERIVGNMTPEETAALATYALTMLPIEAQIAAILAAMDSEERAELAAHLEE